MSIQSLLTALCVVLASTAWAQTPVTIAMNPSAPGLVIPEDFTGLSLGTGNLLRKNGAYVFSI